MYITDFFKTVFRKANIAVLIYLALNTILIFVLVDVLFSQSISDGMYVSEVAAHLICIGISIAVYLVSLIIALSPIGEAILRIQTGCRPLERLDHKAFLEPLFEEVYARAKVADPSLPDDICMYIATDDEPNAFATGRRTVCITTGIMDRTPEQIKGILAHEFGHLSHKDTDLLLVILVGNMMVTAIVLFAKAFMWIANMILTLGGLFKGNAEGWYMLLVSNLLRLIFLVLIAGLSRVWSMIGVALVNKSSREREYEADAFAASLGYREQLIQALDTLNGGSSSGVFATLASTHPDMNSRIARLQTYSGPSQIGQQNVQQQVPPTSGQQGSNIPGKPAGRQTMSPRHQPSQPQPVPKPSQAGRRPALVCSKCGHTIKVNAAFCTKCGAPTGAQKQVLRCRNCGAQLRENAVFCSKCGTPSTRENPAGKNQREAAAAFAGTAGSVCPWCGAERKNPRARFCAKCGKPFQMNGGQH